MRNDARKKGAERKKQAVKKERKKKGNERMKYNSEGNEGTRGW